MRDLHPARAVQAVHQLHVPDAAVAAARIDLRVPRACRVWPGGLGRSRRPLGVRMPGHELDEAANTKRAVERKTVPGGSVGKLVR